MAEQEWPASKIGTLVRELTGRKTTTQLSETDLLARINDFYCWKLPAMMGHQPTETWFELTTQQGVSEYNVDNLMRVIMDPVTIDGDTILLEHNEQLFFARWPRSQTYTEAEPTECLLYDGILYLRAPPDAAYTFKCKTLKYFEPMADMNAEPVHPRWGPTIAYGAAIDVLVRAGQHQEADGLSNFFQSELLIASRPELQQLQMQRSVPRF